MADVPVAAPAEKRAPPKFKQRTVRTFKSKAPKPGQKGWESKQFIIISLILHLQDVLLHVHALSLRFGDDIPGMEGLGTDITVICPWEAFGDMELSDLAKYGII